MDEIICIDGTFTPDVLEFYRIHGIITPVKDKIYTIRETTRHTTGAIGILLTEIINPEVPIKHPILGTIMMEPTWARKRFATLQGGIIEHKIKVNEDCIL